MHFTGTYLSGTLKAGSLALYGFVLAFFVCVCPQRAYALYMYEGADYYLDNTLLMFQTPKMVVYDGKELLQLISMAPAQEVGENYYRVRLDLLKDEKLHLEKYVYMSFVDTDLEDDIYTLIFNEFLEDFGIQGYTALDSATPPMLTDNVFKPYSGENGTQGRWMPMDLSQFKPSELLPIVYITTEDRQIITSKENYINADIYIEPYGNVDLKLGTSEKPISLQIRGRGNSTWRSYKKPYKLKFSSKVDLMGTGKSKHYALIAPFDGGADFLKTQLGTSMSNLLDFEWTPSYKPVELIINDEYLGFYLLIETVRVEKNRVNIFDQEDDYDPEDVTGGWLIEMDNYDDPNQIILYDGDGRRLRYTFHSPEEPTDIQLEWITNELKDMLATMWTEDKSDNALWDKYLDLDDAVRYYLLGELLEDTDRYNGSIYLHRNKGQLQKWHYGPIWDLNSICYYKGGTMSISEKYPFKPQLLWEILKYPQFINRASEMWEQFRSEKLPQLYIELEESYNLIKDAVPFSQARYPAWATQEGTIYTGYNRLVRMLKTRSSWLSRWLSTLSSVEEVADDATIEGSTVTIGKDKLVGPYHLYRITGQDEGIRQSLDHLPSGYYIIRDANGRTIKMQVR